MSWQQTRDELLEQAKTLATRARRGIRREHRARLRRGRQTPGGGGTGCRGRLRIGDRVTGDELPRVRGRRARIAAPKDASPLLDALPDAERAPLTPA